MIGQAEMIWSHEEDDGTTEADRKQYRNEFWELEKQRRTKSNWKHVINRAQWQKVMKTKHS